MQGVFLTLPNGIQIRDRYVIEDLLGKGGYGSVYLVRDMRVKGNLFALKEVIDPSKQERDRFTLECEILRKLDHPALPHVYRAFSDDAMFRAYMLMDYIEGPNLEVLRQRQPQRRLPLAQVLSIMASITAAVSYLHSQSTPIIHRDIKPSNIIVAMTGDEAVLVDFGIAKEYEPDSTTTTVRRCSPGYGAPEQYSGGTDIRTDIYGMAATMYAVLTGKVPADAFQRMLQLGSKGIDPLLAVSELVPDIPPGVSQAIAKAMSINSADRFATIEEFWQALHADLPASVTTDANSISILLPATPSVPAESADDLREATPVLDEVRMPPDEEIADTSGEELAVLAREERVKATNALQKKSAAPASPEKPVLVHLQKPTVRLVKAPAFAARGKKVTLVLLMLITMTGIGMATSLLSAGSHMHGSAGLQATTRPVVQLTQSVARTPAPTPTPIAPTPTATTSSYSEQNVPRLAGTYQGTLTDTSTFQYSHMVVVISQMAGRTTFNGQLTLNRILGGISSSFTGVVDGNNEFSFTISGLSGGKPLHFYGVVQDGAYLHGNYCSSSTDYCTQNSGYFLVGPRY